MHAAISLFVVYPRLKLAPPSCLFKHCYLKPLASKTIYFSYKHIVYYLDVSVYLAEAFLQTLEWKCKPISMLPGYVEMWLKIFGKVTAFFSSNRSLELTLNFLLGVQG